MPSKTKIQSISFPNERLYEEIQQYAENKQLTFSAALLELAETGLQFYKLFHTIIVQLVHERHKDLQENTKFLKQTVESLTQTRIDRGEDHNRICKRIERENGKDVATEFHKKYIEIEKSEGPEAAFLFELDFISHPKSRK